MKRCIAYAYIIVAIKLISSVRRIFLDASLLKLFLYVFQILFCHTLLALKFDLDVSHIIVLPRPKVNSYGTPQAQNSE